ncbi:hypothetical protein G7Y89_g8654 [Cudoniella acicularis]|uniref:Uncharacterized protein n=1 Tax=Cudoniella acicularis TaxID=354080 RepID=A0A8H4RG80_9HELO|nr:hypothetical protein G7Y89_g8654 [Cudoniella acicularis]
MPRLSSAFWACVFVAAEAAVHQIPLVDHYRSISQTSGIETTHNHTPAQHILTRATSGDAYGGIPLKQSTSNGTPSSPLPPTAGAHGATPIENTVPTSEHSTPPPPLLILQVIKATHSNMLTCFLAAKSKMIRYPLVDSKSNSNPSSKQQKFGQALSSTVDNGLLDHNVFSIKLPHGLRDLQNPRTTAHSRLEA